MRSWFAIALLLLGGCRVNVKVGDEPLDATIDVVEDARSFDAVIMDIGFDAGSEDAGIEDIGPDASAEDASSEDIGFPQGDPFQLSIRETADVPDGICDGSLMGMEADFRLLRPADVNLIEGAVGLETLSATSIAMRGEPIRRAFDVDVLYLRQNRIPDQPPNTYLGFERGPGALGPHNSVVSTVILWFDQLSPPSGNAGFEFYTPTSDGVCFVSFTVSMTAI